MKRILLLILLLGLFLTGCSTSKAKSLSFIVFGDLAELQAYQELVSTFEAQNPDISVELIHIPGQSDYRKRLAADFAAGTPADVVLLNYRRYAQFAAKGALYPLGDYLDQSDVISAADFYPELLGPFTWQGQLFCIPQNISSLVVYYNKDMFDQAGLAYPEDDWTWEDFLASAVALTRDLDGDGVNDQHGIGSEVSLARFAPFIWQHGGEVADNNLFPTRLALDWPQSLDALRWLVELQTLHHVVPDIEQEAAEDSESRFLNGRLGMYLNSRRGVPTYRQITGFDWDVASLPQDQDSASLLHSDAYCMAEQVEDKDLVWKFIEFANSPVGQKIIAASGRTVPSLRTVAESPAFLDPDQKPRNARVFLDMIPFIRALPVSANWIDAEDLATEELKRAFYGQVDLETAVQNAIRLTLPYLGGEADE